MHIARSRRSWWVRAPGAAWTPGTRVDRPDLLFPHPWAAGATDPADIMEVRPIRWGDPWHLRALRRVVDRGLYGAAQPFREARYLAGRTISRTEPHPGRAACVAIYVGALRRSLPHRRFLRVGQLGQAWWERGSPRPPGSRYATAFTVLGPATVETLYGRDPVAVLELLDAFRGLTPSRAAAIVAWLETIDADARWPDAAPALKRVLASGLRAEVRAAHRQSPPESRAADRILEHLAAWGGGLSSDRLDAWVTAPWMRLGELFSEATFGARAVDAAPADRDALRRPWEEALTRSEGLAETQHPGVPEPLAGCSD